MRYTVAIITLQHFSLSTVVILAGCYMYVTSLPQVHLDASHNNLSDLPIGATSYWTQSLERLFLSHNSIVDVSQNITELSHLTTLDLSHNKIRSLPPTSFWSGNRLNKLNLSFNQLNMLTHLPESKAAASRGTTPVETPAGGTKLYVHGYMCSVTVHVKYQLGHTCILLQQPMVETPTYVEPLYKDTPEMRTVHLP